jgi:hypothetical protein
VVDHISDFVVVIPSSLVVLSRFLSGQSVIWDAQAFISFRFSFVVHVHPSLSRCEKSGKDELTSVEVVWCARRHSPRQSRGFAAGICKCGAPNQCTSEDMSDVVPCWYHGWTESSLRLWPLLAIPLTGAASFMP